MSECDYSFEMLYKAAYGKSISKKEKEQFQHLTQREINKMVFKWAKKAGWKTRMKIGSDDIEYLAFWQPL